MCLCVITGYVDLVPPIDLSFKVKMTFADVCQKCSPNSRYE